MKRVILSIITILYITLQGFTQSREVPFTLDDRDRIIKTEQKVESLRNEMITRFEAIDHKFEAMDNKIEVLYWGFGIMITLILFLFAYIVIDRKTGVKLLEKQVYKINSSQERLIEAVYDFAKENPRFAESLRKVALR